MRPAHLRDLRRGRLGAVGRIALQHLGHDVARHRRRGGGAGVAVLDHHRQRVARRVIRREGDEQRMRAVFPGQLFAVEMPALAQFARHPPHLRRTRSCPPTARRDPPAGPAARCRRPRSPPPTCPRARRAAASPASPAPASRRAREPGCKTPAEPAGQMRLHHPPAGDARGIGRELQRRHLDVALADAADDGVADVPGMALGRCAIPASGSARSAGRAGRGPAPCPGRAGSPSRRSGRCRCAARPRRRTRRNCSSGRRAGRACRGRPCASNGTACRPGRDSPGS